MVPPWQGTALPWQGTPLPPAGYPLPLTGYPLAGYPPNEGGTQVKETSGDDGELINCFRKL